jgi:hypothetical protein
MRIASTSLILALLLAAPPAAAKPQPLTVKTGESWVFSLYRGQPVRARKANPQAKPGPGQVMVTVTSMMGTTMSISSNNPVAYTYQAELIGTGKTVPARSCTLPANGRLSFEHWPQKATAVRLGRFRIAEKEGACP